PAIGVEPRAQAHGPSLVHGRDVPGAPGVARRPAAGARTRGGHHRRLPGRERRRSRCDHGAGRRAALHLSARVSVQRAARRGRRAAGRARAAAGAAPAGAPAAPAGRGQGPPSSRGPGGPDRRRCGERARGGQGRGAHARLRFALSSHPRVEWKRPLRGDRSIAMPRIYIETYGCQMNVADSELVLGVLEREGYVAVDDPAAADVVLVNTCAVRDHAEQKVLSRVGELKRCKRPGGVLGVVGCMAQRLGPRLLERIPEVDLVVGPDGYRGLPEVTLLGQTVNSYDDGTHDFADLLRAVGAVPGIRRLRFTSPYPTDFGEHVVAAMAATPAVCEHVHLPVQSGSSRVLRRMLRRYDRDRYLAVVAALRDAMPGIALTTDIIVGFPGETEDDFRETLSLVEAVAFDDAFTFRYSPREGTPATRLKDGVPDPVARERLERLVAAVRGIARRKNVALVGSTHEVLVEGWAKRGDLLQVRTRANKVALFPGPDQWIGSYRTVRFTGTTGSTFAAR